MIRISQINTVSVLRENLWAHMHEVMIQAFGRVVLVVFGMRTIIQHHQTERRVVYGTRVLYNSTSSDVDGNSAIEYTSNLLLVSSECRGYAFRASTESWCIIVLCTKRAFGTVVRIGTRMRAIIQQHQICLI